MTTPPPSLEEFVASHRREWMDRIGVDPDTGQTLPTAFECPECGETMPKPVQNSLDIRRKAAWFRTHATCRYGTKLGHDDETGLLSIGDPADCYAQLDLPVSVKGLLPNPPTRVYVPDWLFEDSDRGRDFRVCLNLLADVECLSHEHDCGGTHFIAMRYGEKLIDAPCCEGHRE